MSDTLLTKREAEHFDNSMPAAKLAKLGTKVKNALKCEWQNLSAQITGAGTDFSTIKDGVTEAYASGTLEVTVNGVARHVGGSNASITESSPFTGGFTTSPGLLASDEIFARWALG